MNHAPSDKPPAPESPMDAHERRQSKKRKRDTADNETADNDTKPPVHIRRKHIPKHIKTLVWNRYIGSDKAEAKCLSCREERVTIRSFHCGHVIAEANGGNMTITNLRPICGPCNASMGTQSMNEFTSEFFGWTV